MTWIKMRPFVSTAPAPAPDSTFKPTEPHPAPSALNRIAAARTGERSVASLNETAHLVATRDAREEPA